MAAPPYADPHVTDVVPTTYHRTQIILHWLVLALVIAQFFSGGDMARAFAMALVPGEGSEARAWGPLIVHGFLGTLIFAFMLTRLWVRFTTDVPPPPARSPKWAHVLAVINHWAFYGVLIAMPVLGHSAWWLSLEWAGEAHRWLSRILLGLIALHLAGVIYHQFILKDPSVLHRMAPRDPAGKAKVGPGRR
jgi:cytochrome b561